MAPNEKMMMTGENKRDLSVSMLRVNILSIFILVPVAILQFSLFTMLNGMGNMEIILNLSRFLPFLALMIASIVMHEFIHGVSWVIFGGKPFSAVIFGVQWRALTPFAHLKEPIDIQGTGWVGHARVSFGHPCKVQRGMLVEDHPFRAGCFIYEP